MKGLINTFQKDGFTFNWYYHNNSHYIQAGNTSFIGVGDTYHNAWQDMISCAEAMKDEDGYFEEFEQEDNIRKYLLSYTKRNPLREHDTSTEYYNGIKLGLDNDDYGGVPSDGIKWQQLIKE